MEWMSTLLCSKDAAKAPFLVVGLFEALVAATGMAAETFLVWQILLSIIFLERRYKVNQLLGCFLVSIGVVVTVASGACAGNSLKEGGDNLFGLNPKTERRFYGLVCCEFVRICFPRTSEKKTTPIEEMKSLDLKIERGKEVLPPPLVVAVEIPLITHQSNWMQPPSYRAPISYFRLKPSMREGQWVNRCQQPQPIQNVQAPPPPP